MSRYPSGYVRVKFGRSTARFLHAVILETFVGPCPDGMMGRHLDGNPANNRLDNLRWGTAEENYDDRRGHGTHNDGMRNGRAKLTNDQVRTIKASSERGVVLADLYGVSTSTISHIRCGLTWKAIR